MLNMNEMNDVDVLKGARLLDTEVVEAEDVLIIENL